jgi:hypothetical protein
MSDFLKDLQGAQIKVPDCRFVLPGTREEILFNPFTTTDQKAILKSMEKRDYDLIQEAFDMLLRKTVQTPGFNPLDLYPKDRESLLIDLRRNSVKEEYTHTWTCDKLTDEDKKCGHENTEIVRLAELDLTRLEKQIDTKEVKMDSINGVLVLGMAQRRDEKSILKYVVEHSKDMKKGENSRAELLIASLASIIKEVKLGEKVHSNLKFEEKVELVGKLSLDDRNKIRDFIKELDEYGFDLTLKDLTCGGCGTVQDVEVEWMSFFAM